MRTAMVMLLVLLPAVGCKKPTSTPVTQVAPLATLKKGTQYTVLATGDGKVAKVGSRVSVHYVGTLENGTEFDNSRKRGVPMKFKLGQGQVITGWHEGIEGMKEGEKRRLVIPPHLAYGPLGRDPIPPDATLTFEVELVDVQ